MLTKGQFALAVTVMINTRLFLDRELIDIPTDEEELIDSIISNSLMYTSGEHADIQDRLLASMGRLNVLYDRYRSGRYEVGCPSFASRNPLDLLCGNSNCLGCWKGCLEWWIDDVLPFLNVTFWDVPIVIPEKNG